MNTCRMGLTYPAGREIDQLAHQGRDMYDFPRAMIKKDNLEFSFSGLKSAFKAQNGRNR